MLPCEDYWSPSFLISLQIWVLAGGSESLHGETGSHATQSKCSSSRKNSSNDHPLLWMRSQLYEALIIHKIHWIMIISKPQILGLFHQFFHFGKTTIRWTLRNSYSNTWSYLSNSCVFFKYYCMYSKSSHLESGFSTILSNSTQVDQNISMQFVSWKVTKMVHIDLFFNSP